MGVMDKLVRLLQDEYKLGAELRSGKPIIFIDPKKIDLWKIESDNKNGNLDGTASQMAEQLDASLPGLSQKFTRKELIELVKDSLTLGPFASKPDNESIVNNGAICIINEAKNDEIKVDQFYKTFGFIDVYNPAHLRPLPGDDKTWAKFVGEHEGEHCNQDSIYNIDPLAEVKLLDGEARSDRSAIESLRQEGKHDVIEALIAIRAIKAADGDYTHATSIFINDPDFKGVTPEHLEAAQSFREEMNMGVADLLGRTIDEVEILRTADPQTYAKAVGDALDQRKIPVLRDMTEAAMEQAVAQKMGVTVKDLITVDASKVSAVYAQMKADGELRDKGPDNPYIEKYIKSYVGAVKTLFTSETPPSPEMAAALAPAPPTSTTIETISNEVSEELPSPEDEQPEILEIQEDKIDKELQFEAQSQASWAIQDAVSVVLNMNAEDTAYLQKSNPAKYYKIAEQEFAKGNIATETYKHLSLSEIEDLQAQKIGVDKSKLYDQPEFLRNLAKAELQREGALSPARQNPYMKKYIEAEIKEAHEELAPSSPADAPSTPVNSEKSTISATSLGSSRYAYLMEAEKDDGKGIPVVDLRSADKGQMKIGSLTASEYFATKADPVLAAETLKPQGFEIKDPTLTTKVAQNAPEFRAMA